MLTTEQIKQRTKTVTRRLGWRNIKVGERLLAVDKAMGLKPGQKSNVLAEIEVVSARWEPLTNITEDDVRREGFTLSCSEFVEMFCEHMEVDPDEDVHRIEFRYVEEKR